jgi:hypothetical protein
MSTYRGTPINAVEFNRKDDLYRLVNRDGEIVAELKRHEYLSQPQLRTMRLSSGKHWRPRAAVRGNSAGQSGFTFAPGTVFFTGAGTAFSFSDPQPAKPIEDAGIRAGEVIARRCWRVIRDRLHSTYQQKHVWKPGEPMTGDVRHEYGVHAFKEDSSIEEYIFENRVYDQAFIVLSDGGWVTPQTTPFAIGTIALWGEIVEHERGYRAEFAKIASIDRVDGADEDPGMLERLRTTYALTQAKTDAAVTSQPNDTVAGSGKP